MYKTGYIAPIFITLGISLFFQNYGWVPSFILISLGFILSVYTIIFVEFCKKMLPPLEIEVENISLNDKEIWGYIFSYMIPLIGIGFKDSILLWTAIVVVVLVLLYRINTLEFCPLLLLANYHCYKVELSTGLCDCTVISKKMSVRSRDEITVVVRVSDSLFIDDERR